MLGMYTRVHMEATYIGRQGGHIYHGVYLPGCTGVVYTGYYPLGRLKGRFSPVLPPLREAKREVFFHLFYPLREAYREIYTCYTPLREAYREGIPLFIPLSGRHNREVLPCFTPFREA